MKNCIRAKNLTLQSLSQWLCHTVGHEFYILGMEQCKKGWESGDKRMGSAGARYRNRKREGLNPHITPHKSHKFVW